MKACAISALAQIEASAATGIWDAHRGCSALAGALLISQRLVEKDACDLIAKQVRARFAAGQSSATKRARVSRTLFTESILRELAPRAREPKEIGHDVIYSAYVLRAVQVFGIEPWPSLLEGLTTLVRNVRRSGPGWITVNGKNGPRPMSKAARKFSGNYWDTFVRFDRPLPMEVGDMQLGHLLTHGHAIEMLKHYAGSPLLADLDLAHRKRVQALRLADQEQQDRTRLPTRTTDPRSSKYWRFADKFGDMHGHISKYAYSFLDLKKTGISKPDLQAYGRIVWPDLSLPDMEALPDGAAALPSALKSFPIAPGE